MEYSVSILIPTYNRSKLLKRAIDSSLSQTYKAEVIVCDHGSEDETEEICLNYGDKIRYIRRNNDYGLHFCEMESLLSANGDLIHFCFDDDLMHPSYIEESIKMFNKKVGIVFCEHQLIDIDEKYFNPSDWQKLKKLRYEKLNILSGFPKVMMGLISPSCALIRKKDALKCMYLTNNLISKSSYPGVGPDWLMTAFPFFEYEYSVYLKSPLVKFGFHNDSITIDAQKNFNSEKARKFRAAYAGARLYLIISVIARKFYLEEIYFFIEETFRKCKLFLNKKIF